MSNLKRRKIAYSSLHEMLIVPNIQADEIQAFLDRDKSSINEVDQDGETPLSVALTTGNCSATIVNILLKYGADVNFKDEGGSSVLMKALEYNGAEIKVLLDATAGNEVDRFNGLNPSLCAIKYRCSANIVKLLIKHGADVKSRNENGSSVLKIALLSDCDEAVIKVLLESPDDTDVNEGDRYNNSPFLTAIVHRRSANIVKLLIQHGAKVRHIDYLGRSVLWKAIAFDCDEAVIKVLLGTLAAADVNKDDTLNNTPLLLAVRHHRSANIVKLLLEHGADVRHRDRFGRLVLKNELDHNFDEATNKLLIKYICLNIENFDVGYGPEYRARASFTADCKQEVREMVSVDLGGGRTLGQVITEHFSPHACVANDIEESRNILNQLLERRLDFVCPIYFDMILVKVKKQALASKLQEAVLHSITDFSSVSGLEKVLSIDECAFGISQYLPNDTLFRLLRMFYIPH